MVIQYFGLGMIKASVGDEIVCFAPISKDGEIKGPSFGANVALIPVNDKNYNGAEQTSHGSKESFVISGPGEYEVNGTFIRGIESMGPDKKINTIYSVRFDDMHLVHLGDLQDVNISAEAKEAISDADILFLPAKVEKLGSTLNPKVIVPLYPVKDKSIKSLDKWVVKRKDIEDKESEIVSIWSF
ncbi:MAG TPA: MBL fold metallo-hydrolase [Candidatus Paceibacterota bacterium]